MRKLSSHSTTLRNLINVMNSISVMISTRFQQVIDVHLDQQQVLTLKHYTQTAPGPGRAAGGRRTAWVGRQELGRCFCIMCLMYLHVFEPSPARFLFEIITLIGFVTFIRFLTVLEWDESVLGFPYCHNVIS